MSPVPSAQMLESSAHLYSSWARARVLIQRTRIVSDAPSGFLHATHFVSRKGPAKEGNQEGRLFPAGGVACTLTRPQTVEQDREAEES